MAKLASANSQRIVQRAYCATHSGPAQQKDAALGIYPVRTRLLCAPFELTLALLCLVWQCWGKGSHATVLAGIRHVASSNWEVCSSCYHLTPCMCRCTWIWRMRGCSCQAAPVSPRSVCASVRLVACGSADLCHDSCWQCCTALLGSTHTHLLLFPCSVFIFCACG